MLYLFFFVTFFAFAAALVALPVATAPLVPWWGTLAIVAGELVFLRFTLFKILGFMFAMFVWAGLRMGVRGLRGARVDVHAVTVVQAPGPDAIIKPQSGSVDEDDGDDVEAPEPDAPGTRFVKVECTITPCEAIQASDWPLKHYEPAAFKLSTRAFTWPTFPLKDDESRTGAIAAAAVVEGDSVTPIALDKQLWESQRLALIFKCPPTLLGRAKLQFLVLTLATVDMP